MDKYTYSFSDLKPGTILVCSWGYSMTIVDFYKVIGTRGKATVLLEKLPKEIVSGDGWSGRCIPKDSGCKMAPVRYSSKKNSIRLSSCQYLCIWSGEPEYFNTAD